MEWMGVVLWVLVVALALPLAGAALAAPSLGLQPVLTGAGLVFCVLYIALGGGRWLAWVSFGLALAAAAFLTGGAASLLSDERPGGSSGADAEELAASFAGVEIPLLLTVAFAMVLAASGITTIG